MKVYAIMSTSDSWYGGITLKGVFKNMDKAREFLEKELGYDLFLYDNFSVSAYCDEVYDLISGDVLDEHYYLKFYSPRLDRYIDAEQLSLQSQFHIVEGELYE